MKRASEDAILAKHGPVVFGCARCPEWTGATLEEQSSHIAEAHGITERPRRKKPRGRPSRIAS